MRAENKKLIQALLLLPFNVLVVIPALILFFSKTKIRLPDTALLVLGSSFFIIGLLLAVSSVRLFMRLGFGTPAPWSPPQKLVLEGPYRYVRNPMISGVSFILFAEICFFFNNNLALWLVIFLLVNMIYIPLIEEKGLQKRFGDEYLEYKCRVPRWIPLMRPAI